MGSLFVENVRTPAEGSPCILIVTGKLNRAKGMVATFPEVSLKQVDASHWLNLLAVRAVQLSSLNPLCSVDNSGCPVLGIPAVMMAVCPTAS